MAERTALSTLAPAEVYERYLVPALFGPWAEDLISRLAPHPGERVLDVACGTGALTRQLPGLLGSGATVVGLDLSLSMLGVAQTVPDGSAIHWCQGDALVLPFSNATFEVIFCQQALPFFPDRLAALEEMHRVLVSGGRLGLSVWGPLENSPGYQALVEVERRHLGFSPREDAFSFRDPNAFAKLLRQAGFERTRVVPITRLARFASIEAFVRVSLAAAPASALALARMDERRQWALFDGLSAELRLALEPFTGEGGLVFPMEAHVACGVKS